MFSCKNMIKVYICYVYQYCNTVLYQAVLLQRYMICKMYCVADPYLKISHPVVNPIQVQWGLLIMKLKHCI